jgi:predicted Zn-dependent protease
MQSFHELVLDISDNLNVSNNAIVTIEERLMEIEEKSIEIRDVIRNHREEINLLKDMVSQLQSRVENHDHRILSLEQRADRKDVEIKIINAIAAWQSERTYQEFGWAIQVTFVIREIVDYALSDYERLITNGKDSQLRQSIIDQILAADKTIPNHDFPLTNLLNLSYNKTSSENRELAGYLLEVESISEQIEKIPYLFTLGKTLELAQVPKQQNPAKAAFELCRKYPNAWICAETSKREFVERIVNETASDRLNLTTL